MMLSIRHETRYEYSAPLRYALQSLCLTPQRNAHQTVHQWSITAPGPLFARQDGYGNLAHTWSLATREQRGAVQAQGMVETHAEAWLIDQAVSPELYLRLTPLTTPDGPLLELARHALPARRERDHVLDDSQVLSLIDEILRRVPYRPQLTSVSTTAAQALALQGGVCQDHAHLFVTACRAQGWPARYVSGYFHAPVAAHLSSHAWADVCVDPLAGRWLSVDVTHRSLMDERHVRLAVGPDYAACPPVRGIRQGGGNESMRVEVQIWQPHVTPPPPAPPS